MENPILGILYNPIKSTEYHATLETLCQASPLYQHLRQTLLNSMPRLASATTTRIFQVSRISNQEFSVSSGIFEPYMTS